MSQKRAGRVRPALSKPLGLLADETAGRSRAERQDLDWDRYLAEAKTKREAREALLAESEKHHAKDMAGEGS